MIIREETKNRIIKQLESMPFEEARRRILHGELGYDFGSPSHEFCLAWLEEKEYLLRGAREEEILTIAKEANLVASKALSINTKQLRWAIYAAITAVIAATIAIKENIVESILLLLN